MITKFKTGDKVRFLNEKEEGIVTRISRDLVYVEVSSGFEIPVAETELVHAVIEERKPEIKKTKVFDGNEDFTASENVQVEVTTRSFGDGTYIVFESDKTPASFATKFKLHLLNNTDYRFQFILSDRQGDVLTLKKNGHVDGHSSVFIHEFSKGDVEKWSSLHIQGLYFTNKSWHFREAINHNIKIKPHKFYRDSSFEQNDFFKLPCMIESLQEEKSEEVKNYDFFNKNIAHFIQQKERPDVKPVSKPHSGVMHMEVDLHIEELMDDFRGMSNAAIIQHQLSVFQRKLDEAIAAHYRSVVFIHGVGNGRLKAEVRRLLKNFPGVKFQNASFQRYGFGATEVIIL